MWYILCVSACVCLGINVEAFASMGQIWRSNLGCLSSSSLLKQGLLFTTVHVMLVSPQTSGDFPVSTPYLAVEALAGVMGLWYPFWLYVGAGIWTHALTLHVFSSQLLRVSVLFWDWRERKGTSVKSTSCLRREPGSVSSTHVVAHSNGGPQLCVALLSGNPMSSFFWPIWTVHAYCALIHIK